MLVTSNFSFSHTVFKRLMQQTRKNQNLFGKGLRCHLQCFEHGQVQNFVLCYRVDPLSHYDTFWRVWKKNLFKTLREKEKMLVTSIFSFSHNVLYSIKTEIIIYNIFILSSAIAFNLDKVKFLSSGNGLSKE